MILLLKHATESLQNSDLATQNLQTFEDSEHKKANSKILNK